MIGNAVYLAVRSVWWSKGRSVTVVLCLALTMWLPMTVRLLLNQFQSDILLRAESTPLLIGAKGSRIDLTLHGLYFDTLPPDSINMTEAEYVRESDFAQAIPLHIQYHTQDVDDTEGVPIVGTTVEYFEFRGLRLAQGRFLGMLGDCVLGANVAANMNLGPGDTILSAPQNAFNLAGDYPLRMNITGVLSPSHSPDDNVVFIDLKTAWIIDGIGHGHQQLTHNTDDSVLLEKGDSSVTASAAVLPFTEITPDNVASFHFHGDKSEFPVSVVLAVPHDRKAQTLLLGRYSTVRSDQAQCVKPADVVRELLDIVFRIEQLVWVAAVLSSTVTLLLLGLVLMLSIRLRAAEMNTMFKLGCSRGTIAALLGTEVLIMLISGTLLALASAWITRWLATEWMQSLIF
jgi:putative ABC transport system permease protein